jgi:hypothetical protein
MRTRWVVAALLLAACGEPRWDGIYAGSVLIESTDCDTGEALEPQAFETSVTVAELGGRLTVNTACPYILERSGSTATVMPTSCTDTASDGTIIRTEVRAGSASINGDELSIEVSRVVTRGTLCDSVHDTFVGTRR